LFLGQSGSRSRASQLASQHGPERSPVRHVLSVNYSLRSGHDLEYDRPPVVGDGLVG
jgi:hypothetical protein